MSEPRTFLDGRVALYIGDCRDVLKTLADCSIDSVVTDPPYHLQSIVKRFGGKNAAPAKHGTDGAFKRASAGFMSKTWDGGDIAFQPELWAEVMRVLKPGGYIMAFSGCRTYHRMACAIEDAGFITHPFFAWAFGSGFPKAHSVSKQIDKEAGACGTYGAFKSDRHASLAKAGHMNHDNAVAVGDRPWMDDPAAVDRNCRAYAAATDAAHEWDGWFYGTQSLKPALEPVYFGQKPFERGLNGAQNVLKWGVGAINVGGCKVGDFENTTLPGTDRYNQANFEQGYRPRAYGRDGEASAEKRYAKTGFTNFALTPGPRGGSTCGRWPANLIHDGSDEVLACFPESSSSRSEVTSKPGDIYGGGSGLPSHTGVYGANDSGSAARFFASFPKEEVQYSPNGGNAVYGKNMGGGYNPPFKDSGSAARFFYTAKANADDRLGSKHPTVKPLALIQYLARLITPPGGTCLDPFAGTGTTAEACFREGFRAILIEREAEYIADIERRMSLVMAGPDERAHAGMKARGRPRDDGPLFGNDHKVL